MKHKDSEEMLSGVTLLEVYSHIHTVMKRKEQKEVEDEMSISAVVRKRRTRRQKWRGWGAVVLNGKSWL